MTDFLLGLASFALVLIPLVIIHEFGHFIAAKLVGITVLEFGIGFPPRAKILFTRGDTIYTLNWLPIGGFVRPYGEDFVKPKTETELAADQSEIRERGIKNPKSVFQASPWERILFMAAGPAINLVTALVIFIAIALIGQPFARADVTVYDVLSGSPAARAGLQPGDVLLELNGVAVESADEFNDDLVAQTNETVTLLVERDGKTLDPVTLNAEVVEEADVTRAYVNAVEEDMPAYAAGVLPADVIVKVDNTEITSIKQLQDYTASHEGQEIQVTLLRGEETLVVPVTPVKDPSGTPRMGVTISPLQPAIIGLTAVNRDVRTYTRALPFTEAVEVGVNQFVEVPRLMIQLIGDVIRGDIGAEAARPVSPVGIGQLGGPVLEQSIETEQAYPILGFAAMISIALAFTNLLPIPGLDGGRILFVIIELIRGKPMAPEREGLIHFISLLFLLALIAVTVINDIVNPIDVSGLR
ncbi:MAG: RIP metalloprotease RseP [Anaerolineae bacterium]|nr:RIP metalloprotease RseP [Anaerolineae bacterium]